MTDSSVGVVNQSTGLVSPVDTSTITNDEGTVVQRQRVSLGDPANPDNLASVSRYNGLDVSIADGGDLLIVLDKIWRELRLSRLAICQMADVEFRGVILDDK